MDKDPITKQRDRIIKTLLKIKKDSRLVENTYTRIYKQAATVTLRFYATPEIHKQGT